MRTASEGYKGYEILVVHNPPMYQANIYPKNKNVVMKTRRAAREQVADQEETDETEDGS
jgi:hypothetical protein